jgi:hypothetical protein
MGQNGIVNRGPTGAKVVCDSNNSGRRSTTGGGATRGDVQRAGQRHPAAMPSDHQLRTFADAIGTVKANSTS